MTSGALAFAASSHPGADLGKNAGMNALIRRLAVLVPLLAAAGCQTWLTSASLSDDEAPTVQLQTGPAEPQIQAPLATHKFEFDPQVDDVVGQVQVTRVQGEDTLSDIARRFNLGYEEIVRANPGVDPWLPGEGREIVLPTQFVLPNAPREGLVINLAALRVFYFPKRKPGELQTVITHPIGIGKVGWSTPEGTTKITGRLADPTWYPPRSVRQEYAKRGEKLPAVVPPGPDNPLGRHLMTLGWKSYLIHGTNKPYGVGMRSSHGCIRFYPEDIAKLFDTIPIGTTVHVVNQPLVFGWRGDTLYVQAYPVLEDDEREHPDPAQAVLSAATSDAMWEKIREHNVSLDLELVRALTAEGRGIAVPVTRPQLTVEDFLLADARHVENRLPAGANWDGKVELMISEEEFEAIRTGAAPPQEGKPATAARIGNGHAGPGSTR